MERYRTQGAAPTFTVEVHVLRIGDIAIATSPFELYHDYGVQIKSRSKALQTFVIELTGGSGGYLPTPRAVAGGGYGAVVQSGRVGPEGGQVLVDRTVELINVFLGQSNASAAAAVNPRRLTWREPAPSSCSSQACLQSPIANLKSQISNPTTDHRPLTPDHRPLTTDH